MVLQFLKLDIFTSDPVARTTERQEAEHSAVYGAGVARRPPNTKAWSADQVLSILKHVGLGAVFKPVPSHLKVVLA